MTDIYSQLPPNNIEAEEATIAAALVSQALVPVLVTIVSPSDFFREKNAWVWEAICTLAAGEKVVNQITVANELARHNKLEEVGGQAYLADLIRRLPTYIGAEYYADEVKVASTRRKILGVGSYITQAAFAASASPQSVLDHVYKMLDEVEGHADSGEDWETPASIFEDGYVTMLHQRIEEPGLITGIPCGIAELDRKLGGFKPTKVYCIAAKTSGGKSLFVADNVRRMDTFRHALFTTEMLGEEYVDRIVYQLAKIDKEMVATSGKGYTRDEVFALNKAVDELARRPIFFNDISDLTVNYLRNSTKKLMIKEKVDIIWLDHIDTMVGDANNFNRTAVLSDVTRSLKNFATATNLPVVYTSQRNRKETGGDLNSSLRDSGTKEQDADCIIFLIPVDAGTNKELDADEARARASEPGWCKFKAAITKNRGGTTGTVDLYCDYRHGGRWGAWSKAPLQWKASYSS